MIFLSARERKKKKYARLVERPGRGWLVGGKTGNCDFFCIRVYRYCLLHACVHSFIPAVVTKRLLCAGKTPIKLCINPRGCKDPDSYVCKIIHNEHIDCETSRKQHNVGLNL